MRRKVELYKEGKWGFESIFESYNGWQAYAKWANAHKVSEKIKKEIVSIILNKV